MNRAYRLLLLLTIIAMLPKQSVQAAGATSMHVSVEVVARTIVSVQSQPQSVHVTAGDITRGYIDVASAVAFKVRSNASNGYLLQFQPVSLPFSSAIVSWDANAVTVTRDSSWIAQPRVQSPASHTMSVRLALAPDVTPGNYAWPIEFDAISL